MGIDTPKIVDENVEAMASAEKFTNLQKAVAEYSEKDISRISKAALQNFKEGKFKLDEPSGFTHSGVVYRNFLYALTYVGVNKLPEGGDELNYTLFGLGVKKAMEEDPEFDSFVRDYIQKSLEADKKAWDSREEDYARSNNHPFNIKHGYKSEYLLDPNDCRYTQGKIMAKFILGEM